MKRVAELLSESLERLESGEPLEACRSGLPQAEAGALELVAGMREVELPSPSPQAVALQRARLLSAVRRARGSSHEASTRSSGRAPWPRWLVPAVVVSGAVGLLAVLVAVTAVAAGLLWLKQPNGGNLVSGPVVAGTGVPALSVADRFALENPRGMVEATGAGGAWTPVVGGGQFGAGTRLRTGDLSGVTLVFHDGSRARLGPQSELSVDTLDAGIDGAPRLVLMTQARGESHHEVVPSTDPGSRYEVQTPSATATAKGTAFDVTVSVTQVTLVRVDKGSVAVVSLNTTVLVVAGQITTVLPGQVPAAPDFRVSGEGEVGSIGSGWRIARSIFMTSGATVIIGDPQVGDWVAFEAHLLPGGGRMADRIVLLRRALRNTFAFIGTVEAIGAQTWTISGRAVGIDAATTIDPGLIPGDLVAARGLIQSDGSFLAQSLRLVEAGGTPFAFVGSVESVTAAKWTISGVPILVDASTRVDASLGPGDVVEVSGRISTAGEWLARSIRRAEENEREFTFSGEVQSIDPWQVGGIQLRTESWSRIEAGLSVGDQVMVEGRVLSDGTWLAESIEKRDDADAARFEFTGKVTSLQPWVIGGTTLATDAHTEVKGAIAVGDYAHVQGRILPDGQWLAHEIERIETRLGCLNTVAVVRSVEASKVVLLNGADIVLGHEVEEQGDVKVASVVIVQACDDGGALIIIRITVIYQLDSLPDIEVPGHHDHDDDE